MAGILKFINPKKFIYKVYDENGNFLEVWREVISDLSYTTEINSLGSTINIELARTSDSFEVRASHLQTENDLDILTEDDDVLLATTESANQVGEGSSIQHNNRVDVYVYYGFLEPLLTHNNEVISTHDNDPILASIGAPKGRRVFSGFISEINTRYGSSDTVQVQVTSYGWDLDQFPLTSSGGDTTVSFLSQDPSTIARNVLDKFVTDSASYGTYTKKGEILNTGTSVSYTFRANTYADALGKIIELMPSNWFYYVDLGTNEVIFKQKESTPKHLFFLKKHISSLDLKSSILNVVNRVVFTGGGDPSLFIDRSEIPAPRTRRTLSNLSDNRVTLLASANIITQSKLGEGNKIQYRTTVEILDRVYDIESIKLGDMIGFRNFNNFIDELVMQVVGINYSPDKVQLQLETKPLTVNKRLEDIRRNLTVQENQNVPDSPS